MTTVSRALTDEHRALAQAFLPVAVGAARTARRRVPASLWDDMLAAAYEGLCRAARDWDATLDPDFRRFAAARCKYAIADELRRHDGFTRPARTMRRAYWRAHDDLYERDGRAPRPEEVADHLAVPVSGRRGLFEAAYVVQASMAAGRDVADPGDVCDEAVRAVVAAQVRRAAAALPPRLGYVYRRVYVNGATVTAVAVELNVCQPRVSQMCRQIESALRGAVGADAA